MSELRRRKSQYQNILVKNGLIGIGQDYEQAYNDLKLNFAKHYHIDIKNIEYKSKYVNNVCRHFIVNANIKHEFSTVKSYDGRFICVVESSKID